MLDRGDQEALLLEGLPYHLQGLVLFLFADQQSQKIKDGEDVSFLWNGNDFSPQILLNALYEAGAIHLRYLAEFLGLSVNAKGEKINVSPTRDDALHIGMLSIEGVLIDLLRWATVDGDPRLGLGFSNSLRACLVATNKLVAHPTTHLLGVDHRPSRQELHTASQGILAVIVNSIYRPLQRTDELFEKCPGLDGLITRS